MYAYILILKELDSTVWSLKKWFDETKFYELRSEAVI